MPLGPGSPLSPFSEYASVSKNRKKLGWIIFHTHQVVLQHELLLFLPLTALDWSSALTSCWTALCRAMLSWPCPFPVPPPGPAAPRLIPLSERIRVDPEELLSMYDESSGSITLMPEEADRRLDLADAVPVMASRASTRFLRRFTSSPGRRYLVCADQTQWSLWIYTTFS